MPAFSSYSLKTRPVHARVKVLFELEPPSVKIGDPYIFGRVDIEPMLKGVALGNVGKEEEYTLEPHARCKGVGHLAGVVDLLLVIIVDECTGQRVPLDIGDHPAKADHK